MASAYSDHTTLMLEFSVRKKSTATLKSSGCGQDKCVLGKSKIRPEKSAQLLAQQTFSL